MEPDLGELGCRLGGDAEDVPAGGAIGPVALGRRPRRPGGLGRLAQALGPGCRRASCRRALRAAAVRPPTRERAEDV